MFKQLIKKISGLAFSQEGTGIRTLQTFNASTVCLNREGFELAKGIKKKTAVFAGMLLGQHPDARHGDLTSPIAGEVVEVGDRTVVIAENPALQPAESPEDRSWPVLAPGLAQDALLASLKTLGVDTETLVSSGATVIVNALPPDPVITWQPAMVESCLDELKAGMEVLSWLNPGCRLKLALPSGLQCSLPGVESVYLDEDTYPAGIDALVAARVMGVECPEGTSVVSLHAIWQLGEVRLTGRPLARTILTVADAHTTRHCVATVGTRASELLKAAGIESADTDALAADGVMRGVCWSTPDRGIQAGTQGLYRRELKEIPEYAGDGPCVNCGRCAQVCPARLDPGRLSRFAENAMLDDCRKHYIECCLECGLCTYICTAARPVMQYLRIARQRLADRKGV